MLVVLTGDVRVSMPPQARSGHSKPRQTLGDKMEHFWKDLAAPLKVWGFILMVPVWILYGLAVALGWVAWFVVVAPLWFILWCAGYVITCGACCHRYLDSYKNLGPFDLP